MFAEYHKSAASFPGISLEKERSLIAKAQRGSRKSQQEIVLRHRGFVLFRLRKKVFPRLLHRLGDDLMAESVPVLYQKIKSYDLDYRDRSGHPKPVRFVSYIWKRIDGFIIDSTRKELKRERMETVGLAQE